MVLGLDMSSKTLTGLSRGQNVGWGYVEIMAIMENVRLEFEVRHNVRDQATG